MIDQCAEHGEATIAYSSWGCSRQNEYFWKCHYLFLFVFMLLCVCNLESDLFLYSRFKAFINQDSSSVRPASTSMRQVRCGMMGAPGYHLLIVIIIQSEYEWRTPYFLPHLRIKDYKYRLSKIGFILDIRLMLFTTHCCDFIKIWNLGGSWLYLMDKVLHQMNFVFMAYVCRHSLYIEPIKVESN